MRRLLVAALMLCFSWALGPLFSRVFASREDADDAWTK